MIKLNNYRTLFLVVLFIFSINLIPIGFSASAQEYPRVVFQGKIADGNPMGLVIAGDPNDPNKLVETGGTNFVNVSSDGGRTWHTHDLNNVFPSTAYHNDNDPKIATIAGGKFYLISNFTLTTPNGRVNGGILYSGDYGQNFSSTIFQDASPLLTPSPQPPNFLFFDLGKIAVDPTGTKVVVEASAWFGDANKSLSSALFYSYDNGKTFTKRKLDDSIYGQIQSLAMASDGTIYGAYNTSALTSSDLSNDGYTRHKLLRFASPSAPMEPLDLPGRSGQTTKLSSNSNLNFVVYQGPELVVDTGTSSSHRGRIYTLWAEPQKVIVDSNFKHGRYGFNYDVFESYSDDRGNSWSVPVKVNDDTGTGDQSFPSGRIDANGTLHIVFVDRRNTENAPLFDVYYTNSSDGIHFSPNIRVNAFPSPLDPGGERALGDYLDMVAPYPDRAYIAYPCGQNTYEATCISEIALSDSLANGYQVPTQALSSVSPAVSPLPSSSVPLFSQKTLFTRTLSLGMRGNDVAQLQMFLSKDPALYPEGMATSYYGLHTFAAVKRFQLRNNIQPLGIVGPKTRAKLNRLISL